MSDSESGELFDCEDLWPEFQIMDREPLTASNSNFCYSSAKKKASSSLLSHPTLYFVFQLLLMLLHPPHFKFLDCLPELSSISLPSTITYDQPTTPTN